jgi:hypothetical protein
MPHYRGRPDGMRSIKVGDTITVDDVLRASEKISVAGLDVIALAYYHILLGEWEVVWVQLSEVDGRLGGEVVDRSVFLSSSQRRFNQVVPHIKNVCREQAALKRYAKV